MAFKKTEKLKNSKNQNMDKIMVEGNWFFGLTLGVKTGQFPIGSQLEL